MLNYVKHRKQEGFSCLLGHSCEKKLRENRLGREMDTVYICAISFISVLVTLFFLLICCFECMIKKSKGVGVNPEGHRTGGGFGGGANPGVTITAVGASGMTTGCACGTGSGSGMGGCGGSGGGGGGGGCGGGGGVC